MLNAIIILVVLIAFISAVKYIINQKRKGCNCIGCPHAHCCPGNCTHPDAMKEENIQQ